MTIASITHQKRRRSTVRYAADVVVLGATVLAAWALWPSFLGGSSRLIMVQGHSMEPTYQPGELILLDTEFSPEVGRVVVFQMPDGELGAGALVVHRIVGQRADGTYITQGDNTQNVDAFRVARSDILGSPRFAVPHGGTVIGLITTPVGLGAATGLLSTALLWPRKRNEEAGDVEPSTQDDEWAAPIAADPIAVDPVAANYGTLSDDELADAQAWLQSQLAQAP